MCTYVTSSISSNPPGQASNIGEALDAILVPEEFSEEDRVTGMWWRQLVAGGGAGAGGRLWEGLREVGREGGGSESVLFLLTGMT